jgi:hypothetical protein
VSGRRLLAAVSGVAVLLQLPGRLAWAAMALGVQLLAMAAWDRAALRSLGKWRFWALASVIALLSGLVLAPPTGHLGPLPYSLLGLRTAAMMLCRAATLFGVAVVASRLLTADLVVRVAQRLGMRQLGLALGAAVEILPRLVAAARSEWANHVQVDSAGVVGRVLFLETWAIRLLLRAETIVEEMTADHGGLPDKPPSRATPVPEERARGDNT